MNQDAKGRGQAPRKQLRCITGTDTAVVSGCGPTACRPLVLIGQSDKLIREMRSTLHANV